MTKQNETLFRPPAIERRRYGAVWVVESEAEKKLIAKILKGEQLLHPNEIVAVKRVFTNEKGQRAVQFSYSKRESSKPKTKDPYIEKLDRAIRDVKLFILKRDIRKLMNK